MPLLAIVGAENALHRQKHCCLSLATMRAGNALHQRRHRARQTAYRGGRGCKTASPFSSKAFARGERADCTGEKEEATCSPGGGRPPCGRGGGGGARRRHSRPDAFTDTGDAGRTRGLVRSRWSRLPPAHVAPPLPPRCHGLSDPLLLVESTTVKLESAPMELESVPMESNWRMRS